MALVLGFLTSAGFAQSIRVTTWNLGIESTNHDMAGVLAKAAATLKGLDSDVVLLQDVKDWRTCDELVEALRPLDYRVVVCSAFAQTAADSLPQPQVAILSKYKAYFTWTEPGRDSEQQTAGFGVAFAAIEMGRQRLGFFNTVFGQNASGEQLARKLVADVKSVSAWETNRVQTFVVGISAAADVGNASRQIARCAAIFERAGLVDSTEELSPAFSGMLSTPPAQEHASGERLFAGPMGFPLNARVMNMRGFDHSPLTCELELDPDKVSTALEIRAENRREAWQRERSERAKLAILTGGMVGVGLLVAKVSRARSRRRKQAMLKSRNIPARASRRQLAPVVRPIISIDRPMKEQLSQKAAAPIEGKPALRLQSSAGRRAQLSTSMGGQEPPTLSQEPLVSPTVSSAQNATEPRDKPVEHEARQGAIQDIAGWLKQKFVRKIVTDRAQLIEAQQLATRMAASLDDRLGRIEAQIQQQNQAYLRRIEELNGELAAAREENRELIRERIAQVKAEMEAARARVLAEANLDNSSLRL